MSTPIRRRNAFLARRYERLAPKLEALAEACRRAADAFEASAFVIHRAWSLSPQRP